MEITLVEAMRIYPFSDAKLVGGANGVQSKTVVSANIQEVPYVDRWLKGREILFTAGYAIKNAKEGCDMMRRISKRGIAALAIKPGQYFKKIPLEMIVCADELGLPLFELPENLPYMDCILPILEQITQKQLSILKRVEDMHQLLTNSILHNEGLEGICNTLNRITGDPVFILSPNGELMEYASNARESDYISDMQVFFAKYCGQNRADKLKKNQCNYIQTQMGTDMVVVPVYVEDELLAYLALDMSLKRLQEIDLIAFEHASSLISIELMKEAAFAQRELRIREQLLDDILAKRYRDEKMIIQRGRHVGIDLKESFFVFAVDADSFENVLNSELQDVAEEDIQKIKTQAQTKIRTGMNTPGANYLFSDSSIGVIGLVSAKDQTALGKCKKDLESIVRELKFFSSKLIFTGGMGRIYRGVQNAEKSWKEAQIAIKAGRRMRHKNNSQCLFSFQEMGILCFLSELYDSSAMREFYHENLYAIVEYDDKNNSQLLLTLETYFMHRKNLQKTADALFVHKNTVIYRLNRIEVLLGKKLDNSETEFDLQLCIKLKPLF